MAGDEEPDQVIQMIREGRWGFLLTVLAGFLIKLDFTRKYTNGSMKRFRSQTKDSEVYSSKEPTSLGQVTKLHFRLWLGVE